MFTVMWDGTSMCILVRKYVVLSITQNSTEWSYDMHSGRIFFRRILKLLFRIAEMRPPTSLTGWKGRILLITGLGRHSVTRLSAFPHIAPYSDTMDYNIDTSRQLWCWLRHYGPEQIRLLGVEAVCNSLWIQKSISVDVYWLMCKYHRKMRVSETTRICSSGK